MYCPQLTIFVMLLCLRASEHENALNTCRLAIYFLALYDCIQYCFTFKNIQACIYRRVRNRSSHLALEILHIAACQLLRSFSNFSRNLFPNDGFVVSCSRNGNDLKRRSHCPIRLNSTKTHYCFVELSRVGLCERAYVHCTLWS